MKAVKAGRWTVASSLILIGLAYLFDQWTESDLIMVVLPWWPVLLVALGVEIMFLYRRTERPVRLDVVGIVLVGVIVAAGNVIAGVQQWGLSFSFDRDVFDVSLGENWERHTLEPVTVSIDGQERLQLEYESGHVKVVPHERSDIVIEPTLLFPRGHKPTAPARDIHFDIDKTSDLVSVRADRSGDRTWRFGFQDSRPIALNVNVPAHFSVMVDSDNGDIRVEEIGGNVFVHSDNGKIEVKGIEGNGNFETDTGVITAIDTGGSVEAKATNGAVHVENAGGDVIAKTDNGKILIQSQQLSGNWEADTDLGAIEVVLPESSGTVIEAETDVGHVTSEVPLYNHDGDGKKSTGTIGDGTYTVRLKSDVGNIKIRKTTD